MPTPYRPNVLPRNATIEFAQNKESIKIVKKNCHPLNNVSKIAVTSWISKPSRFQSCFWQLSKI